MRRKKEFEPEKPGDRWEWVRLVTAKKGLTPSTALVLHELAFCWNRYTEVAFPSQKKISEMTGLSLSSVKRAVATLERESIIEVTKGDYGSSRSNSYWLDFYSPNVLNAAPEPGPY